MNQELKDVFSNDGKKIESVQQLLQEIGNLEEKAYVAGVKDTLSKVLPSLTGLRAMLDKTIGNIEATIAMDLLVNKEASDTPEQPPEVEAPPLVEVETM